MAENLLFLSIFVIESLDSIISSIIYSLLHKSLI